ncbi:MAG: M56 family metallopeptidase [Fimbriimonas sp.]|nr:M56 family metallopeptidase [Fimbriimonas sp.]
MSVLWPAQLGDTSGWLSRLFTATWQGGLFIAVVWCVCRIFPRIPAATRHGLWTLAAAQLVLRLFFSSSISLAILPSNQAGPAAVGTPITADSRQSRSALVEPKTISASPITTSAPIFAKPPSAKSPAPDIGATVLTLWLLGVGFFGASTLRRMFGTRKLLRNLAPIGDPSISAMVEDLSLRIGAKMPPIYLSSLAPCPLLAGWRRPVIVLPSESASTMSQGEMRMAIAHELIHLRRCDLWLGLIPVASQILFFFHPLAWLALREAETAREEACDLDAMQVTGGSPAAYARLLLNIAQSGAQASVMGAAIGYRLIRRRINMLKSPARPYCTVARRAFSLLVVAGAVCALPWTVVAQSAQTPPHAKATRKTAKSHRHVHATSAKLGHKATVSTTKGHVSTFIKPTTARATAPAAWSGAGLSTPASTGMALPAHFAAAHEAGSATPDLPVRIVPARAAAVRDTGTSNYNQIPPSDLSTGPASGALPDGTRNTPARLEPPVETSAPTTGNQPVSSVLPESIKAARSNEGSDPSQAFTLEFQKVDLREAIKRLAQAAHMDYVIRSDVTADQVTLSLHHVQRLEALSNILASVKQDLTYRIEAGVVHIIPKGDK